MEPFRSTIRWTSIKNDKYHSERKNGELQKNSNRECDKYYSDRKIGGPLSKYKNYHSDRIFGGPQKNSNREGRTNIIQNGNSVDAYKK